MGHAVSIGERVGTPDEVTLKVTDNGFVFGDSAYETLRTYGGDVFELGRHLARLRRSIARLGFELTQANDWIEGRVKAALSFAGNEESYIRLIVSRGNGDMSYRFERIEAPTVAVYVKPLDVQNESHARDGVSAIIAMLRRNPVESLDPAIKASNLLNNALATREAHAKGAFEAILLNTKGEVAEGAGSNVFAVKQGVLRTPPLACGLLAGITREITMELARAHAVPFEETVMRPADLELADELFITSTLKELTPVVTLDGKKIGSGRPGPTTERLLSLYRKRAGQNA